MLVGTKGLTRDGRRAGFCPGFATRPGNPGSGPGSGSQILNSGFRAGLDFGSGFRVPGRKPGIFGIFFYFRVKNVLNSFGVFNPYFKMLFAIHLSKMLF